MKNDLNKEQKLTHDSILDWFKSTKNYKLKKFLTVGGYAGTGKTFLISEIRKTLESYKKNLKVAFCTYTGKASLVLKEKLILNKSINKQDYIGTIHGLIYNPIQSIDPLTGKKVIIKWTKKNYLDYDLIIVDEASMVNKKLYNDLLSYNKKIIFFGDHGQLPPVDESNFNLMASPTFELTEILRQSYDNPIIKLSFIARTSGQIPFGIFNENVFKLNWNQPQCQTLYNSIDIDDNTIILCGFNKTRNLLNSNIRKKLNFDREEPFPSDRLICLKNNQGKNIVNGQQGTLLFLNYINSEVYQADILLDLDSSVYSGLIYKKCFGSENNNLDFDYITDVKKKLRKNKKYADEPIDLFDFGYAISVHKSQGSEWDRVILFEERNIYWNDEYYARWLYTAITRSKQKLFIISKD